MLSPGRLRQLPGFGAMARRQRDLRPWLANPLGTDAHQVKFEPDWYWEDERLVIPLVGWIAAAISHRLDRAAIR
jgi:hypothetical protein